MKVRLWRVAFGSERESSMRRQRDERGRNNEGAHDFLP
jgi:hypothetical protein